MRVYIIILMIFNFLNADGKIYTFGNTKEFAEQDLLISIQEHLKNNREKIESKILKERDKAKDSVKEYKPDGIDPLESAFKDRVYYPDLTYTLEKDITDIEGRIIYKKGFTFNPANYVNLNYGIIVINGKNEKEVEWLKNSKYLNSVAYKIFITDGSFYELNQELKQDIYYCLPSIQKRFKLKYTPSIIVQEGNRIKITEICLKCLKN